MRGVLTITCIGMLACTPARRVAIAPSPPGPCGCPSTPAPATEPTAELAERPRRTVDEIIVFELERRHIAERFTASKPPSCADVSAPIAQAIAKLDARVLAAVRDARGAKTSGDPASQVEKDAIARAAYEAALEEFAMRLVPMVRTSVFKTWMAQTPFAKEYESAMAEAQSYSLYLAGAPLTSAFSAPFVEHFHEYAAQYFAAGIDPVAASCGREEIDARRGRWIAAFNGKL